MKYKKPAFTLVEILIVVSIIVVLLAMTTSMIGAASSSQDKKRVIADMAVISTALEKFKGSYGDYPRISCATSEKSNAVKLYKCLTGKMYMTVESGSIVFKDLTDTKAKAAFLDASKMKLANINEEEYVSEDDANAFLVDPWGEPYIYVYNTSTSTGKDGDWESPSFILLSKGEDTQSTSNGSYYDTGIIGEVDSYKAIGVNSDNILNGID